MNKYLFGLFLLFQVTTIPAYSQNKGTIWGTVRSDTEKLAGVNIVVKETYWGTTTDKDGYYKLQLPEGNYVLQFRMVGFGIVEDTIQVLANKQIEHHVALEIKPIEYRGVTVEASRYKRDPLYTSYFISMSRARNAPPLGEPDIFKAVAILPGVIQSNDLKGDLHFRGGSSDQNLILLDGIEIYNPYHLLGLFGTFNLQTLGSAEIFIGDFPVKYGDRISSVIDLKTINSPRKITANVSLLSSSISITREWQKIFFFGAARRTYVDLIVPKLPYHFTDLNFKASTNVLKNFNLEVIGFYDQDHLTPESDEPTRCSDDWGNMMGAVRLSWHNHRQISSFLISYEKNFVEFTPDPLINNKINDLTITGNTLFHWRGQEFEFGFSHKMIRFDYFWTGDYNDLKEIFHEGTPEQFIYDNTRKPFSAYLSDKITLSKTALVECGIRYNRWEHTNVWSPRISFLGQLTPKVEAKFSIGRYCQMLAYGREAIEGSVGSLLFPTSQTIYADILTLGLNLNLPWETYLEIEGYQKSLNRITRFSVNFPEFELGQGKIYGMDIFLRKDEGELTFQLSYSFLNSDARFATEHYPFDWDATHTFNGLTGYRIAKGWFLNSVVVFRSGAPITPVIGKFLKLHAVWEDQPYRMVDEGYIEGKRNSVRLPDYFRLDVSLRKKFFKKRYNYEIYLQLLNLLNTQNTLRYDWKRYYSSYTIDEEGNRKPEGAVNSLPIIPSLGVEFEF